jgi:tetratricopeptide (TPR) repeat protein
MADALKNVCDLCEADRLNRVADLHEENGDYRLAASWRQRALALKQISKVADDVELALDYYNLGLLHFALDEFTSAERNLIKALQLQKELLGDEHLDTRETILMLRNLYATQDVYAYVQPVLNTDRKLFGNRNTDNRNWHHVSGGHSIRSGCTEADC